MRKHGILFIIIAFFLIFTACSPYDMVKSSVWKGKMQAPDKDYDIEIIFNSNYEAELFFETDVSNKYGHMKDSYTLTDTNYFYFKSSTYVETVKVTIKLEGFLNYYNNSGKGDFKSYTSFVDKKGEWYLQKVE